MVESDDETLDRSRTWAGGELPLRPGVVVIYSGEQPMCRAVPLNGRRLSIGRGKDSAEGFLAIEDPHLSRAHAEIMYSDGVWRLRDLGSRNGTMVDGQRVVGDVTSNDPRCIYAGRTIITCVKDVTPYLGRDVECRDGRVMGPPLVAALERIGRIADQGDGVLITGESGSGKEVAAAFYHARSRRPGTFMPVNCAAIPEGMAERLFFGARKGAYSGAVDNAIGYLEAASGGVLFLDELGELDLTIQAKLLRVLETRQVIPLGGVSPVAVDILICAATHRDIRALVASGGFRADLFYRIGQREVRLPPLRERPEEIPVLLALELSSLDPRLQVHPSLIEACLLRPWLGNIRELRSSAREAGDAALTQEKLEVRASHLPATPVDTGRDTGGIDRRGTSRAMTKEELEAVLETHRGNISSAARALSMHRTQLYRVMKGLGLKTKDAPADGG